MSYGTSSGTTKKANAVNPGSSSQPTPTSTSSCPAESPEIKGSKLRYPEGGWGQLISQDPGKVAHWLKLLRERDDPGQVHLVSTLTMGMDCGITSRKQWDAFATTRLPCVFLDMLTDPALFNDTSTDPQHFKVSTVSICDTTGTLNLVVDNTLRNFTSNCATRVRTPSL